MKTIAEKVACLFQDDGMKFETAEGLTMDDACIQHKGYKEYRSGYGTDPYRYEFADGSAIVIAGDGWDIEGEKPFSWAGCW